MTKTKAQLEAELAAVREPPVAGLVRSFAALVDRADANRVKHLFYRDDPGSVFQFSLDMHGDDK